MRKQLSILSISGRVLLCAALAWGLVSTAWARTPLAPAASPTVAAADCPPAAQVPSQAGYQQLARQARDRGVLWQLDYQGRTSWLYGTIHVNRLEWLMPGPTIGRALASSDRLALELDLQDPATTQALVAGLRAPAGAPALPAALQQRLEAQRLAACAPAALAQLRPEAQLMTLVGLIGRRQGLDPLWGVDQMLAGMARGLGKPIIGLESAATQLHALVSDDPAEVRRSVRSGLDQLEQGDAAQQLAQLSQAWAGGDLARLERYPQWCRCMNTAAERADYARLIDERNAGMAAAITAQLRAGHTLLVAVGALHMIGPQGLPALLAAQGFTVQPVAFPTSMPKSAPTQ